MVAALATVVSCARCGTDPAAQQGPAPTPEACAECGAPLLSAASGSVLGSNSGRLAGAAPVPAGSRRAARAIDILPVMIGLVAAVTLAVRGAGAPAVLGVSVAVLGFLVAQLAALTTRGRSLARWPLRMRTVDDLTGNPIRLGRFLRQPVGSRRPWRAVTADLRAGRDPLTLAPASQPAPAALTATATSGHDQAVVPEVTGRRTVAEIPDAVAVVLDTGERHDVHGSLLVGRIPENAEDEDHPIFAWPDFSRRLSKTHALLEWSGAVLWVTDLQSVNGTVLVSPRGERQPLGPGHRGAAGVGWTIELGGRSLTVRPSGG